MQVFNTSSQTIYPYLQKVKAPLQKFFHFFAGCLGAFAGGLGAFAGFLSVFAGVYPVFAEGWVLPFDREPELWVNDVTQYFEKKLGLDCCASLIHKGVEFNPFEVRFMQFLP